MTASTTTGDTPQELATGQPHSAEDSFGVSLVLTTCSRAEMLRRALQTLFEQEGVGGWSIEVVVVDDGSTDSTPEVLRELTAASPWPMTVLAGESRGVAAARNLAGSHARGTWMASFDDDQLADPQWLATLLDCAASSGAACVGGSLSLSLPAGYTVDEFGPRARRLLGEIPPSDEARPYPENDLPATNNALVRRDVYEKLGGFDTRFTEGGEDTEFFERVREAGFLIWFAPRARALHMIPEARLRSRAFRLTAMRIGVIGARLLLTRDGLLRRLSVCVGRCCVSLVRDVPMLLLARIARNRKMATDARISLYFTIGLLRGLVSLRGHGHSSRFLEHMDFRKRHGERGDATDRRSASR